METEQNADRARVEETPCKRCGGPCGDHWAAPSPLWNYVMRGDDIDGPWQFSEIICPQCFMLLAGADRPLSALAARRRERGRAPEDRDPIRADLESGDVALGGGTVRDTYTLDIYTALTLAEARLEQLRALKQENGWKIEDVELEIKGLQIALKRAEEADYSEDG